MNTKVSWIYMISLGITNWTGYLDLTWKTVNTELWLIKPILRGNFG